MTEEDYEYLSHFGQIKFAEEKSLCATDFENSFSKFLKEKKSKRPHGRYKFAEINNKSINDFSDSLDSYLE
ncbi:MAG: hypothetical protein P8Y70_00975 [Candidatus Lokiarchaeota archaeon]